MDKEYTRFRSRLFESNRLEWRLLSGSVHERPLYYILTDVTDIDDLIWTCDVCALPPGKVVPSYFRCRPDTLTVFTDGVHAGFAKLLINGRRSGELSFYRRPNIHYKYVSQSGTLRSDAKGPAVRKVMDFLPNMLPGCPYEDLCRFDRHWKAVTHLEIDLVEAVYCPYWPPEAAEWVTRARPRGWPTDGNVKRIVGGGCFFVSKPHQSDPGDSTQWRFSFSHAELILADSWTDVQKYIYHVLRLIKKGVVKSCGGEASTVLCTYFFKTLMFWSCEEKPKEFWEEGNVEDSVGELLCQMIGWLIERRCLNYFIPSNNMIDYLTEDDVDLSGEVASLMRHRETFVNSTLSKIPKAFPRAEFAMAFPNNLLNFMKLHLLSGNLVSPLEPRMTRRLYKKLVSSDGFLPEIRHLYSGISCHLQLSTLRPETRSRSIVCNLVSLTLAKFNTAMEHTHSGTTSFVASLSDSVHLLLKKIISDEDHSPNNNTVDGKHSAHADMADGNLNGNFFLLGAIERWFQSIDSCLPAPVYFVAAAYKANFLYTELRDYAAALKQCAEFEERAKLLEDSMLDDGLIHCSLPLVVTSEWSTIFDEDVQVVVGFVTLCRRIFEALGLISFDDHDHDRRDFALRLCAVEFVKYIDCQCMRKICTEPIRDPQNIPFKFDTVKNPFEKFSRLFFYTTVCLRDPYIF